MGTQENIKPAEKKIVKQAKGNLRWYVVHTYSGSERQAKESLQERIQRHRVTRKFGEILIPTETVEDFKGGVRRSQVRKCFPGYLLVQMLLDEETAHVVRSTPKITDFVGSAGRDPSVLSDKEAQRVRSMATQTATKPRVSEHYCTGELVRVIDGPFANFTGSIEEVKEDKKKVRVLVSIFGRPTPVELDYSQIERTA
ncbi:MAG: transcription termination/antitermination protein NusG [Myxococcota bacterium]